MIYAPLNFFFKLKSRKDFLKLILSPEVIQNCLNHIQIPLLNFFSPSEEGHFIDPK